MTKQLRDLYSSAREAVKQKDIEIHAHMEHVTALKDQMVEMQTVLLDLGLGMNCCVNYQKSTT